MLCYLFSRDDHIGLVLVVQDGRYFSPHLREREIVGDGLTLDEAGGFISASILRRYFFNLELLTWLNSASDLNGTRCSHYKVTVAFKVV